MNLITRVVLLLAFSGCSFYASAQEDVDELLKNNVDDAEKLIGAYVSPFMKSVSLGLNQGWYNTAKPHKLIGIDITVTVNAMTVPTDQLQYEPGKLGLQAVELQTTSPGYPYAPTLLGPDHSPAFQQKGQPSTKFEGPPGLDLKGNIGKAIIPVPMANLGIGLPKSTDLKIRFAPTINIGNKSTLKIFGIGVMHDVKQWIPGIKLLPFDLSGFVGYTHMNVETKFNSGTTGQNQKGVFDINATTVQGLISKKFSVITFYGGIGYNIAKSSLAMKGTYDINGDGDTADAREKDPLNLKFAASGPRATIGFRLKLAVLTLHADYTAQKYNAFTAGIGLSVR